MDDTERKAALPAISYGLHLMSAEDQDGPISAENLNWRTHESFKTPMIELEV